MFRRPAAVGLIAILVLACAVRIGILLAFPSVFNYDTTGAIHGNDAYDTYAKNLNMTGVFGMIPGQPDAHLTSILYTYVLAGLYRFFGSGYRQVATLHILLDLIAIVALYQICRLLLPRGQWIGLLAAAFYALYPYLIFQNLTLIDTPLFMALLYLFIWAVIVLRDQPTRLFLGLTGVLLGALLYTRPVIALFIPFVALWWLFSWGVKQTVLRALVMVVIASLLLLPWIVRNYTVYQAFIPIAANSGENLWWGNNKYTIPFLEAGYHPSWAHPDESLAGLDMRAQDARLTQLAFEYLGQHPGTIPELWLRKFAAYWTIEIFPTRNPSGEIRTTEYNGSVTIVQDTQGGVTVNGVPVNDPVTTYSQPLFDQLGRWVQRIYFGGLFALSLIGLYLTRRQWRTVSILWFVQISNTIVYVLLVPATRYRVPTDPLLFIFSAYALFAFGEYWKNRSQRKRTPQAAIEPGQPLVSQEPKNAGGAAL